MLAVIEEEMAKPYDYATSDCFKAACAVVDVLTGSSFRRDFGGRYRTLLGAQKALRKQGHTHLASFWAQHLPQIEPARAQFGDIAVLSFDGQDHAAVCVGMFWCRTPLGDRQFPLSAVQAAFRVA